MEVSYEDLKKVFEILEKDDKIDLSEARRKVEMKEKEELLKRHPYSIWQNKNGYYVTRVCDPATGKIKQICRKNKEDLEDIIIGNVKDCETITFQNLFDDYIQKKEKSGIKPSTITRYEQVFNRHFAGNRIRNSDKIEKIPGQKFLTKDIRKVTTEELAEFVESEIVRCHLTAKGLTALTGLMKGILKRAKRKKYICFTNDDVLFEVETRPYKKTINPKEQVLTKEELDDLVHYLKSHLDMMNLCLLLLIVTGIRSGELVGLQFKDLVAVKVGDETITIIQIRRGETKYKKDGTWHYDIEAPKTDAGIRDVILEEKFCWILDELKKLNPNATYLATNKKGKRIHTNDLRNRLYRICDKIATKKKKSPHKLRKTYGTILLDNLSDQTVTTSQMGHVDISTTENYYHYDRQTIEQKLLSLKKITDYDLIAKEC